MFLREDEKFLDEVKKYIVLVYFRLLVLILFEVTKVNK